MKRRNKSIFCSRLDFHIGKSRETENQQKSTLRFLEWTRAESIFDKKKGSKSNTRRVAIFYEKKKIFSHNLFTEARIILLRLTKMYNFLLLPLI